MRFYYSSGIHCTKHKDNSEFRMRRQETKWDNGVYYLTVWIENGKGCGTLFNRSTGKSISLEKAISDERDMPSFPPDVSQNLHRILDELRIDPYTYRVK